MTKTGLTLVLVIAGGVVVWSLTSTTRATVALEDIARSLLTIEALLLKQRFERLMEDRSERPHLKPRGSNVGRYCT